MVECAIAGAALPLRAILLRKAPCMWRLAMMELLRAFAELQKEAVAMSSKSQLGGL